MRFFKDLFNGASNGAINSTFGGQPNTGLSHIENLCSQLGWGIDERFGANGIGLNFKDPVVGIRQVVVSAGQSGALAALSVISAAQFSPSDLPDQLGNYLLIRNKTGVFHSWRLTESEGKVGFTNSYYALMKGLDASIFKVIIETLLKEVCEVDSGLRNKGLI